MFLFKSSTLSSFGASSVTFQTIRYEAKQGVANLTLRRPEAARGVAQGFQSSASENISHENEAFDNRVLLGPILRALTPEEMAVSCGPTLSWPHQTELTASGNHFVQEESPPEIADTTTESPDA